MLCEISSDFARVSFAMDCKVIIMTIKTVLGHSDTVAEDTNAAEGNLAQIQRKKMQKKEPA